MLAAYSAYVTDLVAHDGCTAMRSLRSRGFAFLVRMHEPHAEMDFTGSAKMQRVCLSALTTLSLLAVPAAAYSQDGSLGKLPRFEIKDGDRVVFLGSEFTEQAIKHNYFEAELTARWPDRRASFFNMGWSGDTPSGIARGYFGNADEGYKRLIEELDRIKPTVIFLAYGSNFEGKTTEKFSADFTKLYKKARQYTKRTVVLTPPPVESRPQPRPSAQILNNRRRAVTRMLKFLFVSESEPSFFVNLFDSLERRLRSPTRPLTTDGLRFTEEGYRLIAGLMIRALRVEGTEARTGLSKEEFDQLRELIGEKNRLYFHRYRPQNETYLRGFRKHEQGQNAKEIAEFDALISQAEDRVYALLKGEPLPDPIPEPPPVELSFTALDPEDQRAEFTMADGLEISVFASEPMIANPIHMNFDGKGRLWVATSPIYPQIKPGAKPRDEIVILEDADGDGVADTRTVFADDLLIPTAVLPDERGGAYVANSTELLHLADTDGDGKADRRRVVFAGFGTEDTHHILHTFRWGPDGAIYFNQSIYIHTHMETPVGVRRLMGSGIWRYNPKTGIADVVMRGLVNPWGHIFDNYGQSFVTDGASGNGINYGFLGAAYQTAVGYPRTLRGMNPGQPKHCGLEIITGSHWPDEWQETLITNDFRGNRINRFRLAEEGSGYVSTQLPDLLTSKHRAFRPVDLKMGPDGTLFIADWYNPIINHGEVDFRDSRRDYKHGRIWRVSVKGSPRTRVPELADASVRELLDMLKLPQQRTRHMVRIELQKRNKFDVRVALDEWTNAIADDDYALMMESLWTHEAVSNYDIPLLKRLLTAPDHRYRAASVRMLGHLGQRLDSDGALLAAAVKDEHPQVRLEAIGALRSMPSKKAAELSMSIMDAPMDKYLDFGLWVSMRDLEEHWFPTLDSDSPVDFKSEPRKLLFALRAIGKPGVAEPLVKLLESDSLEQNEWKDVVAMIGDFGQPPQLKRIFEIAQTDETNRDAALSALVTAARRRRAKPAGSLNKLQQLVGNPKALHLAGLWQFEPLHPKLQEVAQTGTGPAQLAAMRGLAAFKDADGLNAIIDAAPGLPTRRSAIAQLATFDEKSAAIKAAEFLAALGPNDVTQVEPLVGAFLSRRQGGGTLADALRDVRVNEAVAAAGIRRASSAGRNGKPVVDVFRAIGSVAAMKMKLTPDEMAALIADVQTKGNPQRGEVVYRRSELGCIKCHAIGGAGGILGPDMVSLGASSPMDYIIESMLQPSAKIKEGYHTTTIVTDAGTQVSGKLISEDANNVVIRDAENKDYTVSVESIDERVKSPTSLMPTDLVAKLPRGQFIDLLSFLSSLGKEGPFKVPANRYGRRWLMQDGSTVYSRVDGSLPIEDMKGKVATLEIEVTTPGAIALQVDGWDGLRITRDDLKDNLRAERIVQDLPVGRYRFHFEVTGRRTQPLRVELLDFPELTGRAAPINR